MVFKLIKYLHVMRVYVILLKYYAKPNYLVLSQVNSFTKVHRKPHAIKRVYAASQPPVFLLRGRIDTKMLGVPILLF